MYLSFIPGQNLRQRRLDIICSDLSYWPSSDLACCDLDLTCRWSRCRSDETGAASYLPWRHPPGGARSAGKTYCLQCTTLHGWGKQVDKGKWVWRNYKYHKYWTIKQDFKENGRILIWYSLQFCPKDVCTMQTMDFMAGRKPWDA